MKEELLTMLKHGQKVYSVVRHISKNGQVWHITLLIAKDNEIIDITYIVGILLELQGNKKDNGLVVEGVSISGDYWVVNKLGEILFNDQDAFECIRI